MASANVELKAASSAELEAMARSACKQGLSVINEVTQGPSGDGSDAYDAAAIDAASVGQVTKGVQILCQKWISQLAANWDRNEAAKAAAAAVSAPGEVDSSLD